MLSRLRDFWYEAQKKAKTTARDRGFQGWNDVAFKMNIYHILGHFIVLDLLL